MSQPNLHIAPIKLPPQSQSSIESQDSGLTYEGTRSTITNNTPGPPSYSPASQRSRYSQPNLPTLMIPYNEHQHHHLRSSIISPDRRIRMSQPTLHSSFFGINFVGGVKGSSKLSYSSLRTSGDNSIHSQAYSERLSTPNVHAFGGNIQDNNVQIIGGEYRRGSRLSQSDIRRMSRPTNTNTRERLSQPTLVTGDYYPPRMQHQRLSQPCLLSTWNEKPISLRSPIKQKRFVPMVPKASHRDRMSQLDIGGPARFRYNKELLPPSNKFNRDRFSIPELETQNDLRLIAGTPKQRYSLDSQLNPEGGKTRRLLPIASSPISEHQTGNTSKDVGNKDITLFIPSEGLENIIVATATPIIKANERELLAPILKTTPPTPSSLSRERMSVPEIRNASLRRLLDSPVKQRHSITGSMRQSSIQKGLWYPDIAGKKSPESLDDSTRKMSKVELEKTDEQPEIDINIEPKHIQKHYSYIYDTKDETSEVIGKLGIALSKKKKYLESNFDENEQVITTVIETEVPFILGSPKYNKKTHVYASETPKWMRKCLENDSLSKKISQNSQVLKNNQMNQSGKLSERKIHDSHSKNDKKLSPKKINIDKSVIKMPDSEQNIICTTANTNEEHISKNTCVRIKPSTGNGENKYEVTINSNWSEADMGKLDELNCNTDSEDSTSV